MNLTNFDVRRPLPCLLFPSFFYGFTPKVGLQANRDESPKMLILQYIQKNAFAVTVKIKFLTFQKAHLPYFGCKEYKSIFLFLITQIKILRIKACHETQQNILYWQVQKEKFKRYSVRVQVNNDVFLPSLFTI